MCFVQNRVLPWEIVPGGESGLRCTVFEAFVEFFYTSFWWLVFIVTLLHRAYQVCRRWCVGRGRGGSQDQSQGLLPGEGA